MILIEILTISYNNEIAAVLQCTSLIFLNNLHSLKKNAHRQQAHTFACTASMIYRIFTQSHTWSQSGQMCCSFVKFLGSHQPRTAQRLRICCVPAIELSDFATFAIFGVPARVEVLAKSGLVRTGGGPSGCAKEVPIPSPAEIG